MLENVDRIMNRMQQLETRLDAGPQVDSQAFQQFMGVQPEAAAKAAPKAGGQSAAMMKLNSGGRPFDMSNFGATQSGSLNVKPLAQQNSISCGQTSVAMSINALTGKSLTDTDINNKYGFQLLDALKAETADSGFTWKDGGDIKADSWELIDHKVNAEKTPVVVALNGPEFSPSGHGHIVTIIKTEGDKVTFADPATGTVRTTTKQNMNNAPQHPDGNFIFFAERSEAGSGNAVAANQ